MEPVMVTVFVGKGHNIPIHEVKSIVVKSFFVVSVNNVDIGTTNKHAGQHPSFMQEFKGQVRANTGLFSLSLHQQDEMGRDVLRGYVVVPLQRVLQSGREEGWYDLSSQQDQSFPLFGKSRIAEIFVSLSARPLGHPQVKQDLLGGQSQRRDNPAKVRGNMLHRETDNEESQTRDGLPASVTGNTEEWENLNKNILEVQEALKLAAEDLRIKFSYHQEEARRLAEEKMWLERKEKALKKADDLLARSCSPEAPSDLLARSAFHSPPPESDQICGAARTHTHTHTHVHVHTHTYAYAYQFMHAYINACTHTRTHARTHARARAYRHRKFHGQRRHARPRA
jgi:hypothetical protein